MNIGHGHVFPRDDGAKARCGGPALCPQCAIDQARANAERVSATVTSMACACPPNHYLACGWDKCPRRPPSARRQPQAG